MCYDESVFFFILVSLCLFQSAYFGVFWLLQLNRADLYSYRYPLQNLDYTQPWAVLEGDYSVTHCMLSFQYSGPSILQTFILRPP